MSILETFQEPVDRHHALQFGACCLVVIRSADDCLAGIAEEKRELNCWVRDQRASVRNLRYKGASKHRAAANAAISNAADQARNTLDWLRGHAPNCREIASSRINRALSYVTLQEAEGYLSTYVSEVERALRAERWKRRMYWQIGLGLLFIFIYYPLGLICLGIALVIFLCNRSTWKQLAEANKVRQLQFFEIELKRQEESFYDEQLKPVAPQDESYEPSLAAIANDLRNQYQFLDIACRDLNSKALTWEQLAGEVMADMKERIEIPTGSSEDWAVTHQGSSVKANERKVPLFKSKPPPPPPLPIPQAKVNDGKADTIKPTPDDSSPAGSQSGYTKITFGAGGRSLSAFLGSNGYHIKVSMDDIKSIMREIGYQRMPREWSTISMTAEEKICREVARRIGAEYEDYCWRIDEGRIRAEPY